MEINDKMLKEVYKRQMFINSSYAESAYDCGINSG